MSRWKQIEHYKRYSVSDTGFVRNDKTGTMIKMQLNSNGYKRVRIYNDTKREYKQCLVHRLVAFAFVPSIEDKPHVNHKDGDKKNNAVDNLEWCCRSENMQHAYDTGIISKKLSDVDIRTIKRLMENSIRGTAITLAKRFNVDVSRIRQIANK